MLKNLINTNVNACRKSGVELLKILAIFLIVISHVTQTLGSENNCVELQNYILLLGIASTDIKIIILNLLRQTGTLGNTIFFICSAWFLIGKKNEARQKAFSMLCTVWVVSILILCLYLLIHPSYLTKIDILKQILPTCFSNNWYMSCYIVFLFIFPWLNRFIAILNQSELLRITLFSSFIWIFINYFVSSWFFPSNIILWITIYFLIAYIKIYCNQIISDLKVGIILLLIGMAGYTAQIVVTNYIGLYITDIFANKLLKWNSNCCPFYIMIAIGSLIISLQLDFQNILINYISSLSMFIYLIHENYLFRTYTRPLIWEYLYENIGYEHVVFLDLVYSIILFLTALIISIIYKETIQRLVSIISSKLYFCVAKIYKNLETFFLKESK